MVAAEPYIATSPAYRGNIWRLFAVQALLGFILWVPIWVVQQASQGIASLIGAAIATVDITLCFTICGLTGLAATALVLTVKEPPRRGDEGESPLGYWKNLRTAVGIAARRPIVRALLLLNAAILVMPLVVYYLLLQPYAIGVGLPLASLGIVVLAVQTTTVAASCARPPGCRTF